MNPKTRALIGGAGTILCSAAICTGRDGRVHDPPFTDVRDDVVMLTAPEGAVTVAREPFALGWSVDETAKTKPVGGVVIGLADATGAGFDPVTSISEAQRRFSGALLRAKTAAGRTAWLTLDRIRPGHVAFDILPDSVAGAIEVRIPAGDKEHFYGLGDVWGTASVDLRGHAVRLRVRAGTPDECSYVPFFWSTKGYGIFFDEARDALMDFGSATNGVLAARFRTGRLRWHLFLGTSPMEILRRYLDFTGYPPVVPDWALLPQQWRNEGTWDGVWEDVEHHEAAEIPLGAVWIDRPWALGGYGSDDFVFDPVRYPDPEDHIRRLHERGVRVLVWGCDFITQDARSLAFALENRFVDTRPSIGQRHIDFSNPDARAWWKGEIRRVLDLGIDGIKLDRGQTLPMDAEFLSGADPAELHNFHGYLMCRTYWEALREARGDDFQFVPRAGWAGTQAWSMKWPGDLSSSLSGKDGLGAALVAMQTAALTGFAFWGPDIGGFEGEPIPEDTMIRWIQLGAFSPLMQTCGRGDYPGGAWDIGPRAVEAYRFYGRLRGALLPYLRNAADEAHTTGVPMVRPLALIHPDDERALTCSDEYLFGPDLLVAPVHTPGTRRDVYLPEGTWVDFWDTNRSVTGPVMETVDLPIDRFPLYLRAGATLLLDPPLAGDFRPGP